MTRYFGTYADFEVASKDMAGTLLSADNMIGDVYDISIQIQDGDFVAWLDNRFGQRVGFLDRETSQKLSLVAAEGLVEKAILSFVAFTGPEGKRVEGDGAQEANEVESADSEEEDASDVDQTGEGADGQDSKKPKGLKALFKGNSDEDEPEEGHYWGQVAIICFSPAYEEEFDRFISNVAERIGDDIRPKIDFDSMGVDKIVESDGEWVPSQNIKTPQNTKTMAIIKRRRKISDKMIEQGRAGNKGCYAVSVLFILVLVALVVFGIVSLIGMF